MRSSISIVCLLVAAFVCAISPLVAAELSLTIKGGEQVTLVGAVQRWDEDGNPRKKLNTKQKIEAPEVDFTAARSGNRWVFKDLPAGRYDLVILAGERVRIEGFDYPPVLEFDPFLPGSAPIDDETRKTIVDDIRKSPHYENRVEPLYLGGSEKEKFVRVLVMLIRDKETSYEADMPGAATIRHEVWQYGWQYGGWVKDRRTRVFDRAILPRNDLKKWTWLWDPALGGIEVKKSAVRVNYEMPKPSEKKLKGLYPY
jgi:hypothetical protein